MTEAHFENQYFRKMAFTEEQIRQYFNSALRDSNIALEDEIPEVKFTFAYDALIKIGIALIAKAGYKVRSQPGHHVKIIEKMGELLVDEDVVLVANKMRQSRNADLYDGGILVTEKESKEYAEFAKEIYAKANLR